MTSSAQDHGEGNRLAGESSPYLLQHRDNPVHWRPWGAAALAEAKEGNRPILLSVGYAACHWCHVMAHESFENPDIARRMNAHFVNIKVDREERPDIDMIYQQALQLLGEAGGWPLTMFLTPAGEPFWGGTYFPPTARMGRPGFDNILERVAAVYHSNPADIKANADALTNGITQQSRARAGEDITPAMADAWAQRMAGAVDPVHGGLGQGGPKFPQIPILRQILAASRRRGDARMREAVLHSLERICQGGIYDHVGGGFSRYCVDAAWLVPHFEKMLYDNGMLLEMLAIAHAECGTGSDARDDFRRALFAARMEETCAWLIGDMQGAEGGFAASRDADSDGVEGKFYVWDEEEIDRLLGADAALFKAAYGVSDNGNWEGKNILNRLHATAFLTAEEEESLRRCRTVLCRARDKRNPPLKDDKVLADWNGHAICGLVAAGMALGRGEWIGAAVLAFDFIAGPMAAGEGRLNHAWRAGRSVGPAFLDDYAAMMRAALALYEAAGAARFTGLTPPAAAGTYLDHALRWEALLARHYRGDGEGKGKGDGGYYLTADDAPGLITRPRTAVDHATPSGNGMMPAVLAKLSLLTGEERLMARAGAVVRHFAGEVTENFPAFCSLIDSACFLSQGVQIILRLPHGADEQAEKQAMALYHAALTHAPAERLLLVLEEGEPDGEEPALVRDKHGVDGRATAYVCTGPVCARPVTDAEALAAQLRRS